MMKNLRKTMDISPTATSRMMRMRRAPPFKHTTKTKVHPFDSFGIPGEDRRILCEEHEEHIEKGKVVKIPDMAFVT
jgi:hypothetical protein